MPTLHNWRLWVPANWCTKQCNIGPNSILGDSTSLVYRHVQTMMSSNNVRGKQKPFIPKFLFKSMVSIKWTSINHFKPINGTLAQKCKREYNYLCSVHVHIQPKVLSPEIFPILSTNREKKSSAIAAIKLPAIAKDKLWTFLFHLHFVIRWRVCFWETTETKLYT